MSRLFAHPEEGVNACNPSAKARFTLDLRCPYTPLTGAGHASVIRRFVLALLLFGAIAAPAQAARHQPAPAAARGIVVRVEHRAVVLRALDGSTQRVVVPARAAVSLDGHAVALSALRPGDIVLVVRRGRGAVIEIRAFSP